MKRFVQSVAADTNQFPVLVRGTDGDAVTASVRDPWSPFCARPAFFPC